MTNPVNTQKITSFQAAKVDVEPVKPKSKTVDVLEPSKNGTKTTRTNSKSWFSSCLEKIWNFFKCLFCCGYVKKDAESSTTSKSETDSSKKEASSTTHSATNKSQTEEKKASETSPTKKEGTSQRVTIVDKSQADKVKGLERDIFATRWAIEALKNKDEQEFIKAYKYVESMDKDEEKRTIENFRSGKIPVEPFQIELDRFLDQKYFTRLVLDKDSTNEKVFAVWQGLKPGDRDYFRQVAESVATKADLEAIDAIQLWVILENKPDELAKHMETIKAQIKSSLMQRACQKLLDVGFDKAKIR